ncbi:hypothetical protein [Sphingomonas azotifigens]|uniref:hypothetical protein n=1 Tax=Sphingomonas azotifigens TaxID=330920 RepID=UPI00111C6F31|nr:hypothetical protein [Sphingomonas azotifigens]
MPRPWVEIAAHPLFGPAARGLAANVLAAADDNRQLAAVFKDAGHYITAMSAAYLDTRGGLTPTMLRQICAGTGLLTANRAGALLVFMTHIGVLETGDDKSYRTTPSFRQAWCAHLKGALHAAAMLEPALVAVLHRLDDPATYQQFLALQAARFYAMTHAPDPFRSLRAAFLHPLAGCSILHALVLACTDDAFEPTDGAIVSLAALAQRFAVSQPHVRRVLKRAEAGRFVRHLGPSRRAFDPAGFAMIRYHYAELLAVLIACGQQLLGETPTDLIDCPMSTS